MRNIITVVAIAMALGGCVNTIPVDTKPLSNGGSYFMKAKTVVAERMREPEAARFKSQYSSYSLSNGDVVVCGIANGKNAYGGYMGYHPFYVRFRGGNAVIVHFGEDKAPVVDIECKKASSGKTMISS